MQNEEVKTWLADINQAIAEIKSFLPEKKDFFEFQKDIKTKRAIERNIEIIGEARTYQLNQKFLLIWDLEN
ncbi:MAG: HepT-like ribonuclease domain-containing protein [Candidatus Delongbacteria bacterium]